MIATQKKSKEEILKMLEGCQNIFIVGCGECSTACHTGGEPEVVEIKEFLAAQGKKITGWVIPDAPCVAAKIKSAFAKNIPALKESQAILVLACGSGVQSVKENDRLKLKVAGALDSVFGAMLDAKGNFYEVCSNCGECVLDKTGCICPVTRCAKGLLNGPCGGMNKGKCEVDKDKDCTWVMIYQELGEKNKLDKMALIFPPKDYSKTTKPHKISVQTQNTNTK